MAKSNFFATFLLILGLCLVQDGSSRLIEPNSARRHEREDTNKLCGLTLMELEQEFKAIFRRVGDIKQNHLSQLTDKDLKEFARSRPNFNELLNCLQNYLKREDEGLTKRQDRKKDDNSPRYPPEVYPEVY